jgi:hypothetical protein
MSQLKDWQSGTSNDPYVVGSSGSLTLNQGTANGVPYLNGSKVLTSGSALTFDGSALTTTARLLVGTSTGVGGDFTSIRFNSGGSYPQGLNMVDSNASASGSVFQVFRKSDDTYLGNIRRNSTDNAIYVGGNSYLALGSGDTEQMRLTSTGLGIGTSSPGSKLSIAAATTAANADIELTNVYEISVAGNATMIQLALGVDPEPVGVAPFITATQHWPILLASEYGIQIHQNARAYTFPSLGAYVGGDIVSGVLATGMDRDKRIRLFIDVGTNCEIVLSSGETILTTAAPAGPAFEAASIKCGMRAADGAIEVVKIDENGVDLQVIGETVPVGICGSGLVDAVSELIKVGLLDSSGRFVDDDSALSIQPNLASKLTTLENGERIFILVGMSLAYQ